jgi:hypothetical protein
MSHHYSGPEYGFPHGDARLDLTDLYALPKPGDAGKSILVMDVHPSVAVNPPGVTRREPFATGAVYELKGYERRRRRRHRVPCALLVVR